MHKDAVTSISTRGGSKRISEKNIKNFCIQPLILYFIKAFFDLKLFNKHKRYKKLTKQTIGDVLLNQIIKFAFEIKKVSCLKAEVYNTNYSAIKLYSRFGFEIIKNNGTMLTMELTCENW